MKRMSVPLGHLRADNVYIYLALYTLLHLHIYTPLYTSS